MTSGDLMNRLLDFKQGAATLNDTFALIHAGIVEAVELEREACARAAEGFTEERDNRKWVPGSLYDTLRRETAAVIRNRSNANSTTP